MPAAGIGHCSSSGANPAMSRRIVRTIGDARQTGGAGVRGPWMTPSIAFGRSIARHASVVIACRVVGMALTIAVVTTTSRAGIVTRSGYEVSVAWQATGTRYINQMAFAPSDPAMLYATRGVPGGAGEVIRLRYDHEAGTLHDLEVVFRLNTLADQMRTPIGLGFHGSDLWISRFRGYKAPRNSAVTRLRDTNGDGLFDEHADFVVGITHGHTINQIQIRGDELFVGIGTQTNSGSPTAESAYHGTIIRIPDLQAPERTDLSDVQYLTDAPGQFLDIGATDGRAHVYASGFRNPYGITFDAEGRLWVADNGASAEVNDTGIVFPETPDLIYRDVRAGDRGRFPPPGQPGGGGVTIEPFVELGYNRAPGGIAVLPFGNHAGSLLVALVNSYGTPAFNDVGLLTADGSMFDTEFVAGFPAAGGFPLALIHDHHSRMLVNEWESGAIYALVAVPEPSSIALATTAAVVLLLHARNRRSGR
jgi:hypothetical protein